MQSLDIEGENTIKTEMDALLKPVDARMALLATTEQLLATTKQQDQDRESRMLAEANLATTLDSVRADFGKRLAVLERQLVESPLPESRPIQAPPVPYLR